MKLFSTTLLLAVSCFAAFAQTNIFPSSGNVGIGTTSPGVTLDVRSPFDYNASGTVAKFGGKSAWNTNDYERFQFGFSQLLSVYNGMGWDLAFFTGSSNGVGNEALRVKSNGDIQFNNSATPMSFGMNNVANNGFPSGIWIGSGNASNIALYADGTAGTTGKGVHMMAYYNGGWSTGLRYSNTGAGGSKPPLYLQESGGNVGVGTTSPSNVLQIGANPAGYAGNDLIVSNANGSAAMHNTPSEFYMVTNNRDMALGANGVTALHIKANGRVGIGTKNPSSALAVNGDIYAKKVKVTQTGWADFVFEKDYVLKPLSEVEAFVIANKHLPEVPSADEVAKNDLDLGEMNKILLQKVEELTLYMIQLKKDENNVQLELHKLQEENKELRKRLDTLELNTK